MKSTFALTLTLAAASSVSATFYQVATCNDKVMVQTTMQLVPWRVGATSLGLVGFANLALSFHGIPMAINRDQSGDGLTFFCNGQLGFAPGYGQWRYLDARRGDSGYQLWLDDASPRLQIRVNGNFVQEYSWANKHNMNNQNQLFGGNFGGRPSWLGSNTGIYVIDSGITDTSNQIVADRVSIGYSPGYCGDVNGWGYAMCTDYFMHGTGIARALKDPSIGMVRGANIYDSKIPRMNANFATPLDAIWNFQKVVEHGYGGQKIISFAVSARHYEIRRRLLCAAQWAYYAGVAVVMAAGNNSENTDTWSPYAIIVGTNDLNTSGQRNKEMYGRLISDDFMGTSAATAYTVAAISAISSNRGVGRGNVNTLLQAVKGNGNYNMAYVNVGGWNNNEYGDDHCGSLGLPKKSPNWDGLRNSIYDLFNRNVVPYGQRDLDFVTDRTSNGSRTMNPSTTVTTTF